ncbi:MAG: glycosyltransferase family 2 protein [Gemmatimonadota bacterium]|jgi:cellulose synthase/poly-beta-1,6-N-acetylglucosamine synthase-like glycosyltransferase
MTGWLWGLVILFNGLVLVYFLVLNGFYLATSLFAYGALRRYALRLKTVDLERFLRTGGAPPITLITPAFNEEATLVGAIHSLLSLNYPDFEVLVTNDGSTDHTLEVLREAFNLELVDRIPMGGIPTGKVRGTYRSRRYPNLWVVDKENGGKADALNAGINYCRSALFCAMDADTILERDSLLRIVRPFLEDSTTVAAGGIIRIANGCTVKKGQVTAVRLPKSLLARFQVMEYLRAFLAVRMGWDALDSTLIVSGAFGIFDRSLVVEAGGFAADTVGEDMELIVRLHRHCREKRMPYRIGFIPDPVAWTECPEDLAVLGQQRDRWQRGLLESLIRHRKMFFNPRYGRLGLLAYPYYFFFEMVGPLVEVLGYLAFILTVLAGRASAAYALAFLAAAFAFGMVLSISAVALEEVTFRRYPRRRDLLILFLIAALENLGYRQLNTLWRVKGTVSGLFGRGGWGAMPRKGFESGSA